MQTEINLFKPGESRKIKQMATKKVGIPKAITGYGYAGQWIDGKIGWFAPKHVSGAGRKYAEPPNELAEEYIRDGETDRFFLCKIAITPMTDKNGRPITKILKGKSK